MNERIEHELWFIDDDRVIAYNKQGGRVELALDHSPLLEETIDVLTDLLKENRMRHRREFAFLGRLLYQYLFGKNDRGDMYHEQLTADRDILRVRLRFGYSKNYKGNQKFPRWPWELLYFEEKAGIKESGYFFCEKKEFILSREYAELEPNFSDKLVQSSRNKDQLDDLKILLVVAGPTAEMKASAGSEVNLPPVDYEAILAFLKETENRYSNLHVRALCYDRQRSPHVVTKESFLDALKDPQFRPDIIHFISHGALDPQESVKLLFFTEGLQFSEDWMNSDVFVETIKKNCEPRLIFIQACETAQLADGKILSDVALRLASNNLPAVIAMQLKVEQNQANNLALGFYQNLFTERTVEEAFNKSRCDIIERLRLSERNIGLSGLPILYFNSYQMLFELKEKEAVDRNKADDRKIGEKESTGIEGIPGGMDEAARIAELERQLEELKNRRQRTQVTTAKFS
jgi:hypothetical protein